MRWGILAYFMKKNMDNTPFTQNKHSNSNNKGLFSDLILASLPAIVAFFLLPFAVYLPNQADLFQEISIIIPYGVILIIYICFFALLFYFKPHLRKKLPIKLFYIGVFLALSDIIAPLELGEILDGMLLSPVPEPISYTILEVILALFLVFLAKKIPFSQIRKIAPQSILALILVEIIFICVSISPETHIKSNAVAGSEKRVITTKSNIYHLTLDSFSSYGFLDYLKEIPAEKEFDGFVFFKNNRTNYLFTWPSRASYMSGEIFKDKNLGQWMDKWKASGLFGNLYNAGYEISSYYPTGSSKMVSHEMWGDELKTRSIIQFFHFADLWFLRLVPTFLKQEVYKVDTGVFGWITKKWFPSTALAATPVNYRNLMRKLINDEEARPATGQYVWAHLYIPHFPYHLNCDCNYSRNTSYKEQSMCTIKLMTEFISMLKKQGKYHNSMIIFQADHGSMAVGAEKYNMTPEVMEKISEINLKGISAKNIATLSSCLLLIKPPFSSGENLVVSDKLTQLLDISATVYEPVGINAAKSEGISLFSKNFPENRSVDIYAGFQQKDKNGKILRFGKSIFEGQFNHFSYNLSTGWKVHDNIDITW